MCRIQLCPLACLPLVAAVACAQPAPEGHLKAAQAALNAGNPEDALRAAEKAIQIAPQIAAGHFLRGEAHSALRRHEEAIADYRRVLELDSNFMTAVDRIGGELFKLGQIDEAVSAFEQFIKVRPESYSSHWRYGIALYYAGRYEDGAKQFKAGEVHFGDDVENVFWHYLCNAKGHGVEKARGQMLTIDPARPDPRVPLMEVYKLIRGESTAEKVIAAAEDPQLPERGGNERLFYGHLYVGLNYDALGERGKAIEHLREAEKREIGHYMWDVAKVHLRRLEAEEK